MIKSTELRIGNWIKQAFGYCQVRGTAKNAIWLNDEGGPVLIDSFMLIEPIPLTEDILLKCGFDSDEITFKLNGFMLGWFKNNEFYYLPTNQISFRSKSEIKFLHQLQNLYFCLTGEELICNLK